jgi:APA family basic amino acid/polyamine antiporter
MVNNKKNIGLWTCVAFAVGSMIGAGVFVLSGVAIQQAGPAALIAFGLAGVAVLCSAFSFMVIARLAEPGELGYAPVGRVLGHRFWGFLTAWSFYLAAIIGMAFVLNAFGVYVHAFFVTSVPALVWAMLATTAVALVNLGPASDIGRIESLLVVVKVGILLLLIGFGLAHFTSGDLKPLAPHGASSVLTTSSVLFIAYLGFNVVTSIAGDVRDPDRTVPRAIFLSILIVMAIYAGVAIALISTPLAHYDEASIGHVAIKLMGPIGGLLVPIAALVSTLSAANANVLGSSEIAVRSAARGDIPTFIGRLRGGHPIVSVVFGALLCLILLASRQTAVVIALANVAAISAITLVDVAAIRVLSRRNQYTLHLFGGPVLPAIGLICGLGELYLLGLRPVVAGLVMVGAGGVIYAGRKRFHNRTQHLQLVADLDRIGGPIVRTLHRVEGKVL